jgi:hypothetical protein
MTTPVDPAAAEAILLAEIDVFSAKPRKSPAKPSKSGSRRG